MHIEYTVTDDYDNVKVSTILRSQLKFSRGAIRRLKRCAGLTVNEVTVRLNALVQTGDLIRVNFADDDQTVVPQEMPLDILFEDEHLLAVNKPSNMLVHPLSYHLLDTLANGVIYHWQQQGHSSKFRAASRLDKDTSGLLVVAKDDETHRSLVRQFAGRAVEKEYLALVLGIPARPEGEIDAPIGRDPVHRQKMSVRAPRGREARTSWRIEERFDGAALLRVRIHTGRTHQLRVHLANALHPILG